MEESFFFIGIDIGGTNTSLGLVHESGKVIQEKYLKTQDFPEVDDFIMAIRSILQPMIEQAGRKKVRGIGIGAPNANYYSGNIELAANLPWKGIVNLKQKVEEAMNLPVTITNDANAAAIGEMIYGAAKGMKDFVLVTLGTGLGSGFVTNGQLIYGADGFAGELGHVIAVRNGRLCGCGRKGCLETYASATGIVATAIEFLLQIEETSKADMPESWLLPKWSRRNEISSQDIFEAAKANDPLALNIFQFTGKILGELLADIVAITSPQAIILFGGLAQAGSVLVDPTKKSMEKNLLRVYKDKVSIILSELMDQNAAILGAAALAAKSDST